MNAHVIGTGTPIMSTLGDVLAARAVHAHLLAEGHQCTCGWAHAIGEDELKAINEADLVLVIGGNALNVNFPPLANMAWMWQTETPVRIWGGMTGRMGTTEVARLTRSDSGPVWTQRVRQMCEGAESVYVRWHKDKRRLEECQPRQGSVHWGGDPVAAAIGDSITPTDNVCVCHVPVMLRANHVGLIGWSWPHIGTVVRAVLAREADTDSRVDVLGLTHGQNAYSEAVQCSWVSGVVWPGINADKMVDAIGNGSVLVTQEVYSAMLGIGMAVPTVILDVESIEQDGWRDMGFPMVAHDGDGDEQVEAALRPWEELEPLHQCRAQWAEYVQRSRTTLEAICSPP